MEGLSQGLHLTRSAIATNLKCNFKCKLCGAYSPYYTNPPMYSYENLSCAIDNYFQIVDTVDKFTITGGEPLLHKHLSDIISHLLIYANKIGNIEVITNGSIIPSAQLLNTCTESGIITFLIDNYGPQLSVKIADLEQCLEQYKIPYVTRIYYGSNPHCGGWVDFGDLSKKWKSTTEVAKVFSSCIQHKKLDFCLTIVDGKLFPCSVVRRCWELGITSESDSLYVDLFAKEMTVIEKQNKIQKIFQCSSFPACAYCNGFSEESKRYPPAQQLSAPEL